MTTEARRQLSKTQPLPVVETISDLVQRDPERCYHYRTRIEHVIPTVATPARKWRLASLERLLAAVRR